MARFGVGIKYDTYDADGDAVNKTDALGSRTYKYDGDRRLTEQDLPDGKSVKWTYDAGGRPTQVTDWNGAYLTAYDAVNRKTQETLPSGKMIKHTYDPMGNETSRMDYFGNKYSYTYDALNRPVQVTDPLNGVTGMVYDRLQHVLQIHYPNKTSVNTTYDPTYNVLSVINKKDTGEIISQFVYTYDAVGNKLTVKDNIGKTTYTYDPIYQLLNAAYPDRPTVAYTYDPAGNRTSMKVGTTTTTYTYDTANKLTQSGTVSYTYDGNGNLTKKTDSSNSQTTTYAYDTENRMVGSTVPSGAQFVFGYDYTGMKVSDTQKGPGGILNTQTYLWSGGSVVNEDGDDGQIAHNVVGTVNLSQIYTPKPTKNSIVSYYAFDGLGSVADVTDVTGNLVDAYRYDAYGATLGGGKNKDNHYQYVGRMGVENEASIGLMYMRNRWYDPSVGRFMTQDPIDIRGGLNLYQYVESVGKPSMNLYEYANNDPINFLDWLGLCGQPTAQPSYNLMGENTTPAEIQQAGDQDAQALGQAVVITGGVAVMASGLGTAVEAGTLGLSYLGAAEESTLVTSLNFAASTAPDVIGGGLTATSGFVLATNELNNPSETANNINEFGNQLSMATYFTQTQGLTPLPTTPSAVLPDVLTTAIGSLGQ